MIPVRHIHHQDPIYLNPDLILSVEATPDTVVALTTGQKHIVRETPAEVVELVREWRSAVMAGALAGTGVRTFQVLSGGGGSHPSGA